MQTVQPLVTEIFRANVQYVIPKYQRNYVWDREQQWEPLWADVEAMSVRSRAYDSETHFLGALITKEIGTERNVTQWIVVDGQQRLTTLQLLLAAVHSVLSERGHRNLAGQLEELIRNPDHSVVDPEDRLKILPKGRGYASFAAILGKNLQGPQGDSEEGEELRPPEDGLSRCFSYFREATETWLREVGGESGPQDLARCLQRGLQFVEIRLTRGQNEHAIFEALNARGEPLTEWEKTKNYLLSLAPCDSDPDGSRIYTDYLERFDDSDYWSGERTGPRGSVPRVDHYLRCLAQITLPLIAEPGRYERRALRQNWLYREFRHNGERGRRFHRDRECYLELLRDLVAYSDVYERVTDGVETLSESVQGVLRHREENRIDSLIPVVMVLLRRCGETSTFELCLRALDSFMMRRVVVNARNYGFDDDAFRIVRRLAACDSLGEIPSCLVEELRKLSGSTRWPGDPEIERALEEDEAKAGRPRLRQLLAAVAAEMQAERPEMGLPWPVGLELTLEHVVPQDWSNHWSVQGFREEELGEEWRLRQLVGRFGNLTLVNGTMNSKLSNGGWERKRELLASDNVEMNRRIAQGVPLDETWGEDQIRERGTELAHYVKRIWPGPEAIAEIVAGPESAPD